MKTCFATLFITLVTVFFLISCKKEAKAPLAPDYYTVRKELYENVIEIAGTVEAADEQKLQALSDGTVVAVLVKKGDKVKKGDTIIALDSTEQEYNLDKLDYEIASVKYTGSLREMELLQKQRLSLLQRIEDRKVKATFGGIVADLNVAVGDSLEAKDSCGTLVNIDYLIAEVEIPETDVSNLRVGQEVDFTFPAYNGVVKGSVVSWPAIGEVTSRGATVVKARIRIDEYPQTILPNYSFTGKIVITKPVELFVVERTAIGGVGEERFVELFESGEKIPVKTSPYGKGYVKLEGLDEKENFVGGEKLRVLSPPIPSGAKKSSPQAKAQNNNSSKSKQNPRPMGPPPR